MNTHSAKGTFFVKATVILIWGLLLFAPFLFQDVRSLEVAAYLRLYCSGGQL